MICRFAICIPVYNNPKTIVEVIEKTLQQSKYPLIVVDDGSDVPVESLYLEKNKTIPPALSFIRHEKKPGDRFPSHPKTYSMHHGYTLWRCCGNKPGCKTIFHRNNAICKTQYMISP